MIKLATPILLLLFSALSLVASDSISSTAWHRHAVEYYADLPMTSQVQKHLLNDQIISLIDQNGIIQGSQYNLLDISTMISGEITDQGAPAAVIFLGDGYGGEAFRFHAHHPDTPVFTCDINQHFLQGLLDLVEGAKKSNLAKQKNLAQNLTVSVADATELYKNNDFRFFLEKTQGRRKYVAALNLFHQMKPSDIFALVHQMAAIMNEADRMYVFFDSIVPYGEFLQHIKSSPHKLFIGNEESTSLFIMARLIEEQSFEGYAFPGYANKPLTGQKILHGYSDICYCPPTTSSWVSDVFCGAGFQVAKDKLMFKSQSSRITDWKQEHLSYNICCGRFFEIIKSHDPFMGGTRKIMCQMRPEIAKVANADKQLVEFLKDKTITYEKKPPFLTLSSKEH